MKPMPDARNDRDDADMTAEQIMARLRWLEAMLAELQRAGAAAANLDGASSSAIFRTH
jgi:hypothetical protein